MSYGHHLCHAIGCGVICRPESLLCPRHASAAPPGLLAAAEREAQAMRTATAAPGAWVVAVLDLVVAIAEGEGRACAKERWLRERAAKLAEQEAAQKASGGGGDGNTTT